MDEDKNNQVNNGSDGNKKEPSVSLPQFHAPTVPLPPMSSSSTPPAVDQQNSEPVEVVENTHVENDVVSDTSSTEPIHPIVSEVPQEVPIAPSVNPTEPLVQDSPSLVKAESKTQEEIPLEVDATENPMAFEEPDSQPSMPAENDDISMQPKEEISISAEPAISDNPTSTSEDKGKLDTHFTTVVEVEEPTDNTGPKRMAGLMPAEDVTSSKETVLISGPQSRIKSLKVLFKYLRIVLGGFLVLGIVLAGYVFFKDAVIDEEEPAPITNTTPIEIEEPQKPKPDKTSLDALENYFSNVGRELKILEDKTAFDSIVSFSNNELR